MIHSLVHVKLEAAVEGGEVLYEQLVSLIGKVVGDRYRLVELLDVGGQGILYLAEDITHLQMPLLVKIPLREYHRPAYLTAQKIENSRRSILWEAAILDQFAGTILPEFYDCFDQVLPLHDIWWNSSVEAEDPFLVLEFIHGQTLDDVIGLLHPVREEKEYRRIESVAKLVAREVIGLCEMFWRNGFLYTDLRPPNIMLADIKDLRGTSNWRRRHIDDDSLLPCRTDTAIRLLDAGSVIPVMPWEDSGWPYHLAYVPPSDYAIYEKGKQLPWPDVDFVLYTLGKTLWQFLAAKEPVPGRDPDFEGEISRNYSREVVQGIKDLMTTKYSSFEEAVKSAPIFAG